MTLQQAQSSCAVLTLICLLLAVFCYALFGINQKYNAEISKLRVSQKIFETHYRAIEAISDVVTEHDEKIQELFGITNDLETRLRNAGL